MRLAVRTAVAGLLLVALAGGAGAVPGDIVFERKTAAGMAMPLAQFPHWIHRIHFKCYVCHDRIFAMRAGANSITKAVIMEGKSCGICHNGKTAFAVNFYTCARCHHE